MKKNKLISGLVMTLLTSALFFSACKKETLTPPDGVPVTINPVAVDCSMATDCSKGTANGKRMYIYLVEHPGISPNGTGTFAQYPNAQYKSEASTPLVCAINGVCTASVPAWTMQVPTGNYTLRAFVDTNGDGLPTKASGSTGEPGYINVITISTTEQQVGASGSLWFNLDGTQQ